MGKIFCVMGKSASGKDTIYSRLLENEKLSLKRIVPYTTRPMRDGEEDGKTYHFCDEAKVQKLDEMGKIIELREYNTVYGIWKYFTVDDGQIDLAKGNYLLIGTLETYTKVVKYFGQDKVLPIYIEVEDGERLIRAIDREKQQKEPKYEEMCRRFLADASDFSEENLKKAGVSRRFQNRELVNTIQEIEEYVSEN
ncbi:MAG: guanylate kinase [Agathobacter sp.]|nr:guanylate kinase [Agathobacter sp.]